MTMRKGTKNTSWTPRAMRKSRNHPPNERDQRRTARIFFIFYEQMLNVGAFLRRPFLRQAQDSRKNDLRANGDLRETPPKPFRLMLRYATAYPVLRYRRISTGYAARIKA